MATEKVAASWQYFTISAGGYERSKWVWIRIMWFLFQEKNSCLTSYLEARH